MGDERDEFKPEGGHIEALRREQTHYDLDPQLDKRLNRKFDSRIVPWLFGIWLLAFIDRSNLGNAFVAGLEKDLNLIQGERLNIAVLVFYPGYIVVDIPGNWIIKRVKAGIFLPSLITAWGIVCTFLGFTKSYAGLLVCRFLLGTFEGALLGGIIVYLAMFYRRHEMMYRVGLFYCAAPLSGAFGGLLATGLAKIEHGGYNNWPWIFFIEGAITTVFGLCAFFFMPHTPAHAKFLDDGEKAAAMLRLKEDSHGAATTEDVNKEEFRWHWVRMALRAPQTYFCSLIWIFLLIPLYSFTIFLPTIIKGLNYSQTVTQLFTVPPNMTAFVVVLAMSILSDRIRARGPLMAAGTIVAIGGYIMLLEGRTPSVRWGGTFFVAVGVFPGSALIMGWMSNNVAPHYVRATAVGVLIAFANTAAFVSSFIYRAKDAPDYKLGHYVCIGSLVLCFATICLQILYLAWENKKRERGDRDYRLQGPNEGDLGNRHPAFRYTL